MRHFGVTEHVLFFFFFFFNDTATTEIYTLSLHDALPISFDLKRRIAKLVKQYDYPMVLNVVLHRLNIDHVDRKSTRLNSSHGYISYAVFCLKKKKKHSTTM